MVWSERVEKFFIVLKGVLLGTVIFLLILFCAYTDTHYTRTGWIQTTGIKNEFEFVDTRGNVWKFSDYDLIIPSETPIEVTVKMHTNNTTDYIKDDIILDYSFKNQK
jgi:hypothetical protein